jgi:ribonuclease HII
MTPNLRTENKLRRQGLEIIAGLDEVGKGAWAGPLIAAAVVLPRTSFTGLQDSKHLSPRQRDLYFAKITKNALAYAVGIVSHKLVDRIGIKQANLRAFRLAISKLNLKPQYLLIDGLEIGPHPVPYQYIVEGDIKCSSIAAASVVAKVIRDRFMEQLHQQYQAYGFAEHKGYGTLFHRRALDEMGPTPFHRLSFRPLKTAYNPD